MPKPKRIGILTGGGDCPGLNAVIRAVTKTAVHQLGMQVVGFLDGFRGLVEDETVPLTFDAVSNILSQGGTILGTSGRETFFGIPAGSRPKPSKENRLPEALRVFRKYGLEGIICVGGDGTLRVAHHLHRCGIPMIGVPKTIDNDVPHTDLSFGFNSACTVATDAVDRLHSTAASHHRAMVLEVMGRNAGWIALEAGLAGGGDIVLIPEIPFSAEAVCEAVRQRHRRGRRFSIIVAAEGARPKRKTPAWSSPHGGIAIALSDEIEKKTGLESRATVLGHLQRGGAPTVSDRVLATQFGHAAARLAARGGYGKMVCVKKGTLIAADLKWASGPPRNVPPDSPLIAAARSVGTSFGD